MPFIQLLISTGTEFAGHSKGRWQSKGAGIAKDPNEGRLKKCQMQIRMDFKEDLALMPSPTKYMNMSITGTTKTSFRAYLDGCGGSAFQRDSKREMIHAAACSASCASSPGKAESLEGKWINDGA